MSKPDLEGGLLAGLPREKTLERFRHSPGNEIDSGKFASNESSAALAANTFGFFIERPEDLPPIPGTEHCGWPAVSVLLEECCPLPWWPRGQHPWLDAFVETPTHLIAVESKRYEPYRNKKKGVFSKAYWREVWGDRMAPFEVMRDEITAGKKRFERLDAVQLVKHAFGLVTESAKRGKEPILTYLYAEPDRWPDGRKVPAVMLERHNLEVSLFAAGVAGAAVEFSACTYGRLLAALWKHDSAEVRAHAETIASAFSPLGAT